MATNHWDVRFIQMARLVASWSKDPSSKCGAVITKDNAVVSLGFNGFAKGTADGPEQWNDRDYKLATVIHCEENAIIQANQSVAGCTMYLTGMSCGSCTARLIQAGIKRVVIPSKEEDAFFYRPDSDWGSSFNFAADQMKAVGVKLDIIGNTGFDAFELMGPQHPYMKRLGEDDVDI